MILVDGHCDTLKEAFVKNISLDNENLKFNIYSKPNIAMLQMMATYISPEESNNGYEVTKSVLDYYEVQREKFKDRIIQVKTKDDLKKIGSEKYGIMLTIENGSAIQGNLDNIDYLYNKGIRMMSIVWNNQNDLASGAMEEIDTGLTQLGEEYIKKLNRKNILIDISHSSEKTFWDTVKISKAPIVASHSCVYNLCNHPRNLKDNQIKQIAKMDGIIGIVYSSSFLSKKQKASIKDVVNHIKYVKKLVGIDYVGLGSDFDGLEENHILNDLAGIKDIDNLINELRTEFSYNEIEKIIGQNWLRVIGSSL